MFSWNLCSLSGHIVFFLFHLQSYFGLKKKKRSFFVQSLELLQITVWELLFSRSNIFKASSVQWVNDPAIHPVRCTLTPYFKILLAVALNVKVQWHCSVLLLGGPGKANLPLMHPAAHNLCRHYQECKLPNKSILFCWFFFSDNTVLFRFNGHQDNFPQKIEANLKIPHILYWLHSQLLWKLILLHEMWARDSEFQLY